MRVATGENVVPNVNELAVFSSYKPVIVLPVLKSRAGTLGIVASDPMAPGLLPLALANVSPKQGTPSLSVHATITLLGDMCVSKARNDAYKFVSSDEAAVVTT